MLQFLLILGVDFGGWYIDVCNENNQTCRLCSVISVFARASQWISVECDPNLAQETYLADSVKIREPALFGIRPSSVHVCEIDVMGSECDKLKI